MTKRADGMVCPRSREAVAFAANRLDDHARSRYASHFEFCPQCAALVAVALFSGRFAEPRKPRLAGVLDRAVEVADRLTCDEAEALGRDMERLLAWRALRCVGCSESAGVDARLARDREREAAASIRGALRSTRLSGSTQAEEILGLLRDEDDPTASYSRLRGCDVLAPKPPRLPRTGDHAARRRIVEWATRVLRAG